MDDAVKSGGAERGSRRLDAAFWRESLAPYAKPDLRRSVFDVATSVVAYLALTAVMYAALDVSLLLVLVLAVPAAGFLVRTFIVFHDCAHGSFLPWRRANHWLGIACGLVVYSPFHIWRHEHAVHHASAGDLDRRGRGDVETLTVAEWVALSRPKRLAYRTFRNPLVMLGLGPIWALMIAPRLVPRLGARPLRPHDHRHEHRPRGAAGRPVRARGLARRPGRPAADRDARRRGRYLDVLRAAPVRGRLLGAQGGLELRRSRAARQLVPEAAETCFSSSPATSACTTSTT